MLLDFVHAKFHVKYMLTKRVEMKKKEKLGVWSKQDKVYCQI